MIHADVTALHLHDHLLGLAALVVEEVDVAIDAGVGALLVALAGRAFTKSTAHHSKWCGLISFSASALPRTFGATMRSRESETWKLKASPG